MQPGILRILRWRLFRAGICRLILRRICLRSLRLMKKLLGQRTRWFRGTMEVAFKYGRLMSKLSRKRLDAEATLFGPFVLVASLLSYLVASGAFFVAFPFDVLWR